MNDNQGNNISSENKPQPIRKKKIKPEYEVFIEELSRLLGDSVAYKSIDKIYRHLKRGYSGSVDKNQISEVVNMLAHWEFFPYLALRMGAELVSAKTSQFVRIFYPPIQHSMAVACGYPLSQVPLELRTWNNLQNDLIMDWVASNTIGGYVDPNWARKALVCLLKPNTNDLEFQIIHTVVDRCVPIKRKQKSTSKITKESLPKENKHKMYVKRVAHLFFSKKFSVAKLEFALDFSSVFEKNYSLLERDFSSMSRDLDEKKKTILSLESNLHEAELMSKELDKKVTNLENEIMKTKKELMDEKQRYELLNNHWKEKIKSELNGVAYEMKMKFGHEVQEARLSLQSNPADIPMAIDRLKNMDEYLKKLGENDG
jgi:hypothetical protein